MKTTASMRKRINSLLEELGEGWSEGDPFEGRNGHPTIPMAYQGKLVGNLAFPNYGTLRYIWGSMRENPAPLSETSQAHRRHAPPRRRNHTKPKYAGNRR